jgi:diguanylate cyclase (GGDEF)-like protein/PAS domain S-box-containing protein
MKIASIAPPAARSHGRGIAGTRFEFATMPDVDNPLIPAAQPASAGAATPRVDVQLAELVGLVDEMRVGIQPDHVLRAPATSYENRLVEARLGVASGLFAALRSKYAPTAAHSLRVALGISSWALALKLPQEERDQLELAALLHDVGKIGVPDAVLLKPGSLSAEEALLMDRHRAAGLDILSSFCGNGAIVDMVRHSTAWFDGSRVPAALKGTELPLGARMLSIVDAFDSMTTDHVYRRAMSRERALNELFHCAGRQFDPELVRQFAEVTAHPSIQGETAKHWLHALDPAYANGQWQLCPRPQSSVSVKNAKSVSLFEQKLLDNMQDAVMFVDTNLQITLWNHGAERLTGIAASGVIERIWQPSLLSMRDERGREVLEFDDPITLAVKSGEQEIQRLSVMGRGGRPVTVDVHAVPVVGIDGATHGAAVLLHDASPQASLEKLCHSLHERATKDPLTQIANRAEFDRSHAMFVAAHLERHLPCSLIVCDIDHFKNINDTYGHQAGDEALKAFAQLLKGFCRSGDLVARYGGEEFVVLCADCNNATATQKADQIRKTLAELPIAAIGGKSITASFGVTEVQAGDTPETMLRRSDRALYEAKERGRNLVVQLGSGINGEEEEKPSVVRSWLSFWFGRNETKLLVEKWLITSVPLKVTIEKLRGFVADHHAEIESIEGDVLRLRIEADRTILTRRTNDRPISFLVELTLTEERGDVSLNQGLMQRTRIHVAIRPRRDRDRRRSESVERARMVMASMKSYLMAAETDPPE